MSHHIFPKLAVTGSFAVLVLSCSFLQNAASQTSTPGAANPGAAPSGEDSRVQAALDLRSVQMTLETAFPGEAPRRILVSIDAAGNQYIEMALPVPEGSSDTSNSPEANLLEIFVIEGAGYSRIGKEGQAKSSPDQTDALHRILYNPAGPGMWLMLLPKDAQTPAGTETRGGFQATRFVVDGTIEEGTIRGEIWQDEQTKALVGANLSVSESLFYPPDSGRNGTVTIQLTVEKADVLSITLP